MRIDPLRTQELGVRLSLSDVYEFSDKRSLPAARDVDRLEKRIGSPLPAGYREFMSTLGVGRYCDDLNVYNPEQVWKNTPQHRQELAGCFESLSPENRAILGPADAARGFAFGYCEGAYSVPLWHVPGARYPIYIILPNFDQIIWAETGLHDPRRWTGAPGPFEDTHALRPCFMSMVNRRTIYVYNKAPVLFSDIRARLEQLLPGCVTVAERTDDTGRYYEWQAWNRNIGGRVSALSDFVTGEAGSSPRFDEAAGRIVSSQAHPGIDVCLEHDRDASRTVDQAVAALCADGFVVRIKRNY
jgi:hypothetical protein